MRKYAMRLLIAACCLTGCGLFANGIYIQAKAALAQELISLAWERNQSAMAVDSKPWPWADTFPVAKLSFPGMEKQLTVLSGSSGRTLAFGPGIHEASTPFGQPGTKLVAAHRDTHFRILRRVRQGELLVVEDRRAVQYSYTVTSVEIVDSRISGFEFDEDDDALVLVTCYPFDSLRAGGPLRYVVTAYPVRAARFDHN